MLLNLSNHPSANWSAEQTEAAISNWGSVEDMPFPQIPPEWETYEVEQLVEEYYVKITKLYPMAVHLMGELTFCFALVAKLQQAGISCVAATTLRNTIDKPDGTKIANFRFIKFRSFSDLSVR
ncbi:MAG: CRISPR-associated protein [Sphingobacteriales bacterium]|nr:MAG: CRISPR-associated protein [Sphingobacteriales bacterium]